MNARTLIERLSRGVVLKRRLPRRFGRSRIHVTPDAALSYWKLSIDAPDLYAFADRAGSGQNVWDIGANVGVFAVAAAHRVGPSGFVLAVEPDPWLASLLQRTAGRYPQMRVLCSAIGDRSGVASFVIARRGRASNSLESTQFQDQGGGARAVQFVPVLPLDSLLDRVPAPDLIKIDVEGADLLVLSGGSRILSQVRPMIQMEVTGRNAPDVMGILRGAEYEIYDPATGAKSDEPLFNILAVPHEKANRLLGNE